MTNETENQSPSPTPEAHKPHEAPKPKRRLAGRALLAAGAIALLAVGGGVGAATVSQMRPQPQMAPAVPVAISAMKDDSIVTLKGKVAEVYGAKFVLADESGRTLVETGRAGKNGDLVKADEQITVQGRFDDGFVKAAFLVRADGKVEAIGGFGPKHERGDGPKDRGPDRDRDGPGPKGPEGRL